MSADIFLDANVLLYSLSATEPEKAEVARGLLDADPCISPQVAFEALNVMIKKWRIPRPDSVKTIRQLVAKCRVYAEDEAIVREALFVFERYGLQSYDSKIVATALSSGASTLYSEDMQDGLVIEGKLTIVNPFRA